MQTIEPIHSNQLIIFQSLFGKNIIKIRGQSESKIIIIIIIIKIPILEEELQQVQSVIKG